MTGRHEPISLDLGQVDVIIQRIVKKCLHLPGNHTVHFMGQLFRTIGVTRTMKFKEACFKLALKENFDGAV